MTGLYVYREINVYRRVAIAVRHYASRTNEGLSLAITQWVTQRVVKKFYSEGCIRCAVQTALNIGAAATAGG